MNKPPMEILKEIAVAMLNDLKYLLRLILKFAPTLINIFNPFISVLAIVYRFEQRGMWSIGSEMFIPIILSIVSYILESVNKALYDDVDGIPVYSRRFTEKDSKGNVKFNPANTYEMALYLAEVEDELERRGKYKCSK